VVNEGKERLPRQQTTVPFYADPGFSNARIARYWDLKSGKCLETALHDQLGNFLLWVENLGGSLILLSDENLAKAYYGDHRPVEVLSSEGRDTSEHRLPPKWVSDQGKQKWLSLVECHYPIAKEDLAKVGGKKAYLALFMEENVPPEMAVFMLDLGALKPEARQQMETTGQVSFLFGPGDYWAKLITIDAKDSLLASGSPITIGPRRNQTFAKDGYWAREVPLINYQVLASGKFKIEPKVEPPVPEKKPVETKAAPSIKPMVSGRLAMDLPGDPATWEIAYKRTKNEVDEPPVKVVLKNDGTFASDEIIPGGDIRISQAKSLNDSPIIIYKRKIKGTALTLPADADAVLRTKDAVDCQFTFPPKMNIDDLATVYVYLDLDDSMPVYEWHKDKHLQDFQATKTVHLKLCPGRYMALAQTNHVPPNFKLREALSVVWFIVSDDPEENRFEFNDVQPGEVAFNSHGKPPIDITVNFDKALMNENTNWYLLATPAWKDLMEFMAFLVGGDQFDDKGTFKFKNKPGCIVYVFSTTKQGNGPPCRQVAMFKENVTQSVSLNFPADADYVVWPDQTIDCKIKIPIELRQELGYLVVSPPAPSRLPLYVWDRNLSRKFMAEWIPFCQTGLINLKVMPGKYLAHLYKCRIPQKQKVEEIGTLEMTVTADPQKNVFEFKPDHPAEQGPKQGNQPIDE
jgi:hypothetical protein